MPSRTVFASLAGVVVAAAGCGGTNKAATTAVTSPGTAATSTNAGPPEKLLTYKAHLTGSNGGHAGAPNASGLVVVTLEPRRGELCWTFSQLTNVTAPTKARLYHKHRGTATIPEGLPLNILRFEPSGCLVGSPIVLGLLRANPHRFYISILNAQFPRGDGAVRGQL
jgi:hypothetical protein